MTRTKRGTKRALLLSVVSLLVCVTMLMGTTYAWFTDSVTSANNIIKSGNLSVELDYWDGTAWKTVDGASDVLAGDKWEPGYVDIAYLRLKNTGSLSLKYALGVNVVSETAGVNAAGEEFFLSDYIYFDVFADVDGEKTPYADRAAAMKETTENTLISAGYNQDGTLAAGSDYVYLAMVVYMPTTVGNDANHNGVNAPKIDLGINVFATQNTEEKDSFDEYYDRDTAVFSVTDANAMLAENKDVTLVNCNAPAEILYVPSNYTGTLILHNVKIASIQESAVATTLSLTEEETAPATEKGEIVILGDVVVKATENGMSAITGTELNLSGKGTLTAIAKGDHAYGIGGPATKSINIEGITIANVAGGHAYGVGTDTKYYKDAPEGGAAIGSGLNGAQITLENVTVNKAVGGSKAAGIGASYHTGVNVTITDSTIVYVEGGVSAAAIGGSRVSNGASEAGTTVTIIDSTVTAKGGAYGAGIGSGYDTHCQAVQPLCTINITGSTVKATGGKYAAGIGTGYHTAALAGEIKDSVVNAVSGDPFYKDAYTSAMDIGFGVVDPAREGQQTDSKLIYNGIEIGIPAPGKAASVSSVEELKTALSEGIANVYLAANIQAEEPITIGSDVVLNGNGYTISRATGYTGTLVNVDAGVALTVENTVLDGSGATATGNLIATGNNASVILNEGAILQNNNGAHAVNLGTRIGATLTINGGEIINNSSDSGAIWGGGHITMNAGKINNNSSTGIGGAIRMVSACHLTMNGGEISNNTAAGDGGAIWGYGSSTYKFNGGKMNGNTSAGTGGAIYIGTYSVIEISGDFELCNNKAANSGAIRLTDHTSMTITGGKISGNTQNGDESNAFNTWNNTISITAGELEDNMSYIGGLSLTIGAAEIDGVIAYDLSTNHNTAYLAAEFNSFKFTVDESNANFSAFNFKPAKDYTYTAGDEAKLICMNEGYSTYWDAATGTFKLQAN